MQKIQSLFRFLFGFILILLFAIIILIASDNSHLIKAVKSTYFVGKTGPTILDYTKFDNKQVRSNNYEKWNKQLSKKIISDTLLSKINSWETSAIVITKNKKLIFEKYWGGFSDSSLSNSFSMAKSFVSIAIGVAIKEGRIKSVNQLVSDYIPEFKSDNKKSIKIINLLQMSSGLDFGESYGDPFGFMAKTYYGNKQYELTINKPSVKEPGLEWKYQGGNTLLLSFILEKATGKSLSEYFGEKIWSKIGARHNALWSYSKNDNRERAYCCFYSNAKDYARLGQLYLDKGKWNGKALVDSIFFQKSITPVNINNVARKNIDYYGLHWWLGEYKERSFFYARGILGQYIVVIPELDIVLVRLGHKRDKTRGVKIPKDLFVYLDLIDEII
jgi:CubicO group peptidase (beta-lactamase class C family)